MSTTLPQTKEELIDWLKGTPAKNPPPATFHAHGKDWFPHTPGDPMPCDPTREVWVLFRDRPSNFSSKKWNWHDLNIDEPMEQIIGWRYAAPQPEQPDELETLRAENDAMRDALQCVEAHLRACHGKIEMFCDEGYQDQNPLKIEINFRTVRKIMNALKPFAK